MARLRLWMVCAWTLFALSRAAYVPQDFQTVCSASWHPMALCEGSDPSRYSEYDIELFRKAARLLGWVEGQTYAFKCMGFDTMLEDLQTPGGNCSIGIGGITITTDREEAGIEFSYPTYSSSLALMVTSRKERPDAFYFLKPYSWDVWLAMGVTVLFFPLLIFLIDTLSKRGRVRREDWGPGMKEATWATAWTAMSYDPFPVRTWSARVTVVTFGFLALVFINTWQANLAAFLTVNNLKTSYNSVSDLRGMAVGSLPIYSQRMAQVGISSVPLEFKGLESTDAWITQLRSGALTATAVDEPLQLYLRSINSQNCDLGVLADTFSPFDYGFAFRNTTETRMVQDFDRAILGMLEDGTLSILRNTYINTPVSDSCGSSLSTDSNSLAFGQMAGLWYILAGGLALGLLLLAAKLATAPRQWRVAAAAGKGGDVAGDNEAAAAAAHTSLIPLLAQVRELCDEYERMAGGAAQQPSDGAQVARPAGAETPE